jgi:Ca2+-binding RTX toxin-like protein
MPSIHQSTFSVVNAVRGRDMASFFDRKNVNNVWNGGKQDDVMSGNGGHDIIRGGSGNDRIYGGDGHDRLHGDDGNDFLQANTGDDYVDGGNGNDIVRGSTGLDTLIGGAGADTFVFDYAGDTNAALGIDTVVDFNPAEGDRINIASTMEAYAYNPGYVAQLVPDESYVTNAYQQATLSYDASSNVTTVKMYFGDNDPDVDMTLYVVGNHTTIDGFMGFYL